MLTDRECKACNKTYKSKYNRSHYCSTKCRDSCKRPKIYVNVTCSWCGKEFKTTRKHSRFCSHSCCTKSHNKRMIVKSEEVHLLSTVSLGAWGELIVSADLIKKGYYVFRSICGGSPYDLIACKDNRMIRVEVTVGYRKESGAIIFGKHTGKPHDLICIVFYDGTIFYTNEDANPVDLDKIGLSIL